MKVSTQLKAQLALLCAVMLWSTSFVAIRAALKGYSPGALSLFRFSIASFCFAILYFYNRKPFRLEIREFLSILIIGVLGIAAYSVLLNSGEKTVSSAIASFLISQTPVMTAALAILFLRERPDYITIIGIGVSCFGVSLIVMGEATIQVDLNAGLVLIMLATVCGSLHLILQKPLFKNLTALEVISYATWIATLFLLWYAPQLISEVASAPPEATWALLYLGIIPSTLAGWCWGYGLSQTLVVNASSFLYAMPILSAAFGWLLLGEIPSPASLVGGSIALLGAAIVKKDLIRS